MHKADGSGHERLATRDHPSSRRISASLTAHPKSQEGQLVSYTATEERGRDAGAAEIESKVLSLMQLPARLIAIPA